MGSFSASLELGIFQCFGCGASGNLLEFAALMEQVNPKDGRAFRAVALKLQKQLGAQSTPEPRKKSESKEVVVNPVLDFELKGLDGGHQFLRDKKLTAETVRYFGLGFCSRGSLKDSLAIPLRNADGSLLGYASERPGAPGQYGFPEAREREGKLIELRPSLFLYHGHGIKAPAQAIILVQDFASAWWLWQGGFRSVVATMGGSCSEEQAALLASLVAPTGRVWVVSGSTDGGERFAKSCLERTSPCRFVRWLRFDWHPTELSPDEIRARFET